MAARQTAALIVLACLACVNADIIAEQCLSIGCADYNSPDCVPCKRAPGIGLAGPPDGGFTIPHAAELRAQQDADFGKYMSELEDIILEGANAILYDTFVAIQAVPPVVKKVTVELKPTARTEATLDPHATLKNQFDIAEDVLKKKGYCVSNVRLYDTVFSFTGPVGVKHTFSVSWEIF